MQHHPQQLTERRMVKERGSTTMCYINLICISLLTFIYSAYILNKQK